MLAAKLIVDVLVKNDRQRFCANVYELHAHELFNLHPTDFYKKWGGVIPDIPHFEIEVVKPTREEVESSQTILHVHRSCRHDDERSFVCYPKRIPSAWSALENFCVWCVGSAITLKGGPDLNTLFSEARGDVDVFLANAAKRHCARIAFKSIEH